MDKVVSTLPKFSDYANEYTAILFSRRSLTINTALISC